MRITSDGKLGLGISSPANILHLNKSSGDTSAIVQSGSVVGRLLTNATGTYVGTTTDHKFTIQTNSTAKVTVLNTGNVGIGTTSPGAKLEVDGNIRIVGGGGDPGTGLIAYTENSGEFKSVLAAYRLAFFTGGNNARTESARIDHEGRLLVGTSSQPNTGGTLCVNNGIGIVNNTTSRFATVEHGNGASGTFTTITISATVPSGDASVIFETLMTGFSGVYLDNVSAQYSNQAAVTMRSNASAGTSAALTVNGTNTIYTLTITTNVTHPVVKVKVTAGGIVGNITLPTITFA